MKIGDKINLITQQYVGGTALASMVNKDGRLVMQTESKETIAEVISVRENDYTVQLDDGQWWILDYEGKLITRGY